VTRVSGECPEVANGDPVTGVRFPDVAVNSAIEPGLLVLPPLPANSRWAPLVRGHPENDDNRRVRRELSKRSAAFFIYAATVDDRVAMFAVFIRPREGFAVPLPQQGKLSSRILLIKLLAMSCHQEESRE